MGFGFAGVWGGRVGHGREVLWESGVDECLYIGVYIQHAIYTQYLSRVERECWGGEKGGGARGPSEGSEMSSPS